MIVKIGHDCVLPARAAVVAVCALVSFTALAKPIATQGLVSFTYGGKNEFVCDKPVV